MRRWVIVAWMLVGFLGQGYVFAARPRWPVPIERDVDPATGLLPAWWLEPWS